MPTACPATATCQRSSRWVRCRVSGAKQAWHSCFLSPGPTKSSNMYLKIRNDIGENQNVLSGSRNVAGSSFRHCQILAC